MKIDEDNANRFQRYVETMCRGLFILSVPGSKPSAPELIMKQYADLELKGKVTDFVSGVENLVAMSRDSKFGQHWGNRISYIGSRVKENPNKGFIYVQFYSQFGILAFFR